MTEHLFAGLPLSAQGGHPVPPEQLSAKAVASAIRRWATANNLCSILPGNTENQVLENGPALSLSETQTNFLRARGITSIAYNDDARKVLVYTRKKVSKEELKHLPNFIGGCEIEYPQGNVDDIGSEKALAQAQGSTYTILTSPAGATFYTCGSSISPGNVASAGTLGFLVRDPSGTMFGFSNNHVTGACSHSPIQLPIVAPGVIDVAPGGVHPFTIGLHHRTLDMRVGTAGNVDIFSNRDAALFHLINPQQISSMQGTAYDTPSSVADITDNMVVEKVGRTTGHTSGKVVGKELVPIGVNVEAATYNFRGVVYFSNAWVVHGDNNLFSDGGDSGALVVSHNMDGTRSAVGVVFAGGPDSLAPGGKKSLVLPLRPIIDELGVTLVHGHNV